MAESRDSQNREFFQNSKRGRGWVKHDILDNYLGTYIERMSSEHRRLIYIDGFAGSGWYENQPNPNYPEKGSPLIAYKTITKHHSIERFDEIVLIFIEKDRAYAQELDEILENFKETYPCPPNVRTTVVNRYFDEVMADLLRAHLSQPMLIFVDPFGVKGIPMSVMSVLAKRPNTELLITIMFSFMSQFYGDPKTDDKLNRLLGVDNTHWKTTQFNDRIPSSVEFVDYYLRRLLGEDFTKRPHLRFEVKNGDNDDIYQFIFIPSCFRGYQSMKKAMNNNSQRSDRFVFSEFVERQQRRGLIRPQLMSDEQIICDIIEKIFEKFNGNIIRGRAIAEYVCFGTPYVFRFENELKQSLRDYILINDPNFDDIMFRFPPK